MGVAKTYKDEERYACPRVKTCKYARGLGSYSGQLACHYALITGKVRGGFCKDCTVYEPKKRGRRKKSELV